MIKNVEGFYYELGVMMFNAAEDDNLVCITGDYDILGNFVAIIDCIGDVDYENLKEGFIAEAINYNIEKDEAEEIFKKAIDRVENF